MKFALLLLSVLVINCVTAQNDSLPPAVYKWQDSLKKADLKQRKYLFDGSTLDLENIRIHTSTLEGNKTNHPPRAHTEYEELIIIKEGNLKVIINDSVKVLGPLGIAFIEVGDSQSFQNATDKPVTYYVVRFKSKNKLESGKPAGGSLMRDWGELQVKKTDKGESRPVFDKQTSMFKRLEVHATTLNPGFASHAPHTHREEEITFMLRGNGEMQIGEVVDKVTPGDVAFAEANVLHGFKNTGQVATTYYAIKWQN